MIQQINSLLPICIEVLSFDVWGRYTLKLNKITLRSKSAVALKVGEKYLAQLSMDQGRLTFSTLIPYPKIYHHEEGLELIQRLMSEEDASWFKPFIIKKLLLSNTALEYSLYKNMLYACLSKTYYIPFVLENQRGLFELQKKPNCIELYLFIHPFGPLSLSLKNGQTIIKSPFSKVKIMLAKIGVDISVNADIKELFSTLLDYKG